MEKKLGSLFDGIGGFPLAAKRNGIRPIWASDIEKFPMAVTRYRFPKMTHMGDITKLHGENLPVVDIIAGGSPCQDLSVAGRREGLAGVRSGLFLEQIRIVKEMRKQEERRQRSSGRRADVPVRPRYMVWENVPGAFSSGEPKGADFRRVLEEVCGISEKSVSIPGPPDGTWTPAGIVLGSGFSVAWRVLDAQFWGVPQRRRRIFLVADFGGYSAGEILFESQGVWRHYQESKASREKTAQASGRGSFTTAGIGAIDEEPFCIAGNIINRQDKNGGNGCGYLQGISYTLTATDQHCVAYMDDLPELYQNVIGALCARDEKGVNSTYVSQDKCIVSRRKRVRRITPLECERLMGFPDHWTDIPGASDGVRYRALGNSVAIPCVEYILSGIAYFLEKQEEEDVHISG